LSRSDARISAGGAFEQGPIAVRKPGHRVASVGLDSRRVAESHERERGGASGEGAEYRMAHVDRSERSGLHAGLRHVTDPDRGRASEDIGRDQAIAIGSGRHQQTATAANVIGERFASSPLESARGDQDDRCRSAQNARGSLAARRFCRQLCAACLGDVETAPAAAAALERVLQVKGISAGVASS
jgi:hypothetical protein